MVTGTPDHNREMPLFGPEDVPIPSWPHSYCLQGGFHTGPGAAVSIDEAGNMGTCVNSRFPDHVPERNLLSCQFRNILPPFHPEV